MLNLGRISNTNPILDKKVKFFHDYFHYYLSDDAKKIDGFPENHLTYLEKMLVRLDNLTKMQPSTRRVIALWLEEYEFDTVNDEFSKKKEIKPLVLGLKAQIQNKESFDVVKFIGDCNQLVFLLNGSEGISGKDYFKELLKSQISMLQCPHELEHHKLDIIRNSIWMVAEFVRQGFDEKELGGLNGIFRRLVKFGHLKDKEKVHKADFPLPEDLRSKKESPNFEAELEKYLGGSHFKTQFDGMFNALSEKKSAEIYFLIEGIDIELNSNFIFLHDNVTITSNQHLPIIWNKNNSVLKNHIVEYFASKDSLVAKVAIIVKSVEKASQRAKYKVTRALDALRYLIGGNYGKISDKNILFIYPNNNIGFHSKRENSLSIDLDDINFIIRHNFTIPKPDNISIENERFFNRCNRIFFKGLSSTEPDDIITYFWQYWEATFYFYGGNQKGEKIIKDLALILAKDKSKDVKFDIGHRLYIYALNNCESNAFGISPDFYTKWYNCKLPQDIEAIVSEIEELTTYPFLVNLIEKYHSITDGDDSFWRRFYTKLLWQLYEQRNFIHHDGTYCDATLEHLRFYFRTTVVRWQSKLFTEMEKTPGLGMEEIIKNLKSKSILN